jgi:uncharacterized membrane protein YvlD (DUF360 family)
MNIILVTFGLRRAPTWQERIVAFLVRWAILTLAVWIAAAIVPGIVLDGWKSAIVVGLILGFLNAILKPILFIISLPITVLTLGLFLLIINTGLLALTAWIAGQIDGISFDIDGFWDAFLGALIISLVSWILGSALLRWVLTATAQDSHSVYGPLAAPIAILVWLYISALTVLIGAGVNAAFDDVFPQESTERARRELMARLLRRTSSAMP